MTQKNVSWKHDKVSWKGVLKTIWSVLMSQKKRCLENMIKCLESFQDTCKIFKTPFQDVFSRRLDIRLENNCGVLTGVLKTNIVSWGTVLKMCWYVLNDVLIWPNCVLKRRLDMTWLRLEKTSWYDLIASWRDVLIWPNCVLKRRLDMTTYVLIWPNCVLKRRLDMT